MGRDQSQGAQGPASTLAQRARRPSGIPASLLGRDVGAWRPPDGHREGRGAARRAMPDPEIGVLPRGRPSPPHCRTQPPVPPRPSLLLPQSRKNSSLLSGLDSTLSERSDIQLPKEPGASKGTLGVPVQTPACFIHSPPPAPPLRLPLPHCSPGHPRINCLMPPLRAPSGRAGEGWKSASHCPAGDLSPGTHPHPRPQPGKGWAQRGCSRRLGGESS